MLIHPPIFNFYLHFCYISSLEGNDYRAKEEGEQKVRRNKKTNTLEQNARTNSLRFYFCLKNAGISNSSSSGGFTSSSAKP